MAILATATEQQFKVIEQAAHAKGQSVEQFVDQSLESELCALEALKDTDALWAKIIKFPAKS